MAHVHLPGLSVVLPCLDEEAALPGTIADVRAACALVADRWELVVVDDGSADRTADLARAAGARVVSHDRNRGYGAALRSGIAAAREPWILIIDADGQFDPVGDLPRLAEHAAEADLVVGYRQRRRDSALRRLNGRAWSWLMRRVLGLPVRDVDCAFKLLRAAAVRDLPLRSEGALLSAELLAAALARGARLAEVPVAHRPRVAGEASGADLRVIARAFRELALLKRSAPELRRGRQHGDGGLDARVHLEGVV